MGATRRYFRDQFRVNKLTLEHEEASDFYLTCWQSGFSTVPLLCIRLLVFAGCLAILISSLVVSSHLGGYWIIFMTHWGLLTITVASGLALLVSVMAFANGSIDSSLGLPWYVKLYWMVYSIALPVALFITIFYYSLLYPLIAGEVVEIDPVLDLFIHGINSVMMFCLLLTAQHPLHLLQFLYPFIFTIAYLLFSVFYYLAGGINPNGDPWIYPLLDWTEPGPTTGLVFGCAAFLLILHVFLVGVSELRDFLIRRYLRKSSSVYFTE